MCGISCAIALDTAARRAHRNDRDSLGKTLDLSLQYLKHRGPDATGQWISENGRVGTLRSTRLEMGHTAF
jgi:asparagine synthase (glutamine-hydrolysing)